MQPKRGKINKPRFPQPEKQTAPRRGGGEPQLCARYVFFLPNSHLIWTKSPRKSGWVNAGTVDSHRSPFHRPARASRGMSVEGCISPARTWTTHGSSASAGGSRARSRDAPSPVCDEIRIITWAKSPQTHLKTKPAEDSGIYVTKGTSHPLGI